MTSTRLPRSAYERAERLLGHRRSELVLRTSVRPRWIDGGPRFWYRVDTEHGPEFVLVDPEAGTREVVEREAVEPRERRNPLERVSPNERWAAFRRGHDLWARAAADGEEFALTTDGTTELDYAVNPEAAHNRALLARIGVTEPPPVLAWSPDSRRILTHRTDQRGLATMPLVEAAPADGNRPRLHGCRYAMPGETVARGEWLLVDIAARTTVPVATEPFPLAYRSPITFGHAWWAADSATVYWLDRTRELTTLRLRAIDAASGHVRTLIEETGDTRVEPAQGLLQRPMVHVFAGGDEALWYWQRDGWGHLYLYDLATGQPTAQVTKGEFAVQEILHVDEESRAAVLSVSGLVIDDPYRRTLVSVGLDGGALTWLTDDDLDHAVTASTDGRWYVDSASTVDTPPVTTLRDRTGTVVLELERADITRLLEAGWTPPERVRTIAADGTTPIYGVLYKPYGFDPRHTYPVVDHTYPTPAICRVQPSFDQGGYGPPAEAVAALGFAVLAVDGRGTPGRDKAFHDHSYRNMGGASGIEDHVAALRQLAETRPWLDLGRVGVFGHSGGGYGAMRAMLAHQDVYHVGVAESGNHDNRAYHAMWAEMYDGPFDADAGARLSNTDLADRLAGKLLLVHGEMDDNVTPHLTMRLVDRLIAADKDFELLVVPNAEHSFAGYEHYVVRRRWDFLVRHLMGAEPPEYRLAPIPLNPEFVEVLLG